MKRQTRLYENCTESFWLELQPVCRTRLFSSIENIYEVIEKMKREWFSKYVNGEKGVISILLAALLVPSVLLSDALIETSRYHATVSTVDSIMDSAATSTLANYDSYLLDRFGLPAVTQEKDMVSVFQTYYDSNAEGSLNAWELKNLTVEGKYALSDKTVLEHEIMEFSKYTVPTDIAADTVMSTIEELLGDLDGLKAINACMDAATDTVNAVDACADAMKALEELKQVAETVDGKKNTYEEKYTQFKNSVTVLAGAIGDVKAKEQDKSNTQAELDSAKADKEAIDVQIQNCKKNKADLENDYNNGIIDSTEYESQSLTIDTELKSLENEQKDKNNRVSSAQSTYNEAVNKLNAAKNKVDNEKSSLKKAKNEYVSAIIAISDALKGVSEKTVAVIEKLEAVAKKIAKASTTIANTEDQLSVYKYKDANKDLDKKNRAYSGSDNEIDQKARRSNSAHKGWNTRRIHEAEERINEAADINTAFNASVTGVSEAIDNAIDQYDEKALNGSLVNLNNLKTKVNHFDVNSVTSVTVISDAEYHVQIAGYAPLNAIQNAIIRIDKLLDQNGESENVWNIIKGIRAALQGLLKVKMAADLELNANVDFGKSDQDIGSMESLLNGLDRSMEGSSGWTPLGKLRSIVRTARAIIRVGKEIVTEIQQTALGIKQLCNSPGNKILLAEYLTRTCSNRCTYTQTNALTGYPYSRGGLAPLGSGSTKSFCGAEAEYLIHGKTSEYSNQANIFFRIYMLRLLLDIWPVINNTEVKTIARAAGIVSFQIFTYIVPIIYCIVEPLIDTMVIVNGGEINILKSCVYLTPSGFPTLLQRLTQFKLTPKEQSEITDTFKSNVRNSVKDKTGHRINFKKAGEGYGKDNDSVLIMSYRLCMFILMAIRDKNTLLERFQNIIVMESRQHYGNFNIEKSYTYLTATSNGQYKPFLSAAQIYAIFAFSKSRVITRGY